ncbi:hypothetical protein GGR57DRAFT_323904 [Xylariaceae sp. FL1272]|nr:hypothetical protein GGR57DRAFT_323904 [Xylariaceae sp. FL1272]
MYKFLVLLAATLAASSPVSISSRAVTELDQAAFDEAQQPDTTATKAFTGTSIKTGDGRCLFVDELSGDFRANLTPIQVADCGSTDGQGWDVITSGKHNDQADSMLVVSTLTNACFNFDPRRAAGNQVLLFSCGGRADGGGSVTNSQLFPFTGGAGPLSFSPENQADSCFTVAGEVLDIAPCAAGDQNQLFTFGDAATADNGSDTASTATDFTSTVHSTSTVTQIATVTQTPSTATSITSAAVTTAPNTATGIPNPTSAVPVSGAGGTLIPSAVAESHPFDTTATRAFTSVSIQSPDGRCLFIDPTSGDFRENLIPITLVACAGTPNEKFDLITAGAHNNAADSALIVSSLMNGCISFDGRRPAGNTVNIFSCGGRADGGGETNSGQLIPFTGGTNFVFAPESEGNSTCIVPGDSNLVSAPCAGDGTQVFTILS